MKLMMIDLDGTLFDTKKVNYLAYMEAMQVYGYKIDYELSLIHISEPTRP